MGEPVGDLWPMMASIWIGGARIPRPFAPPQLWASSDCVCVPVCLCVAQTGDAYIQSVNVELMKLGLRGVSLLFASGDGGVAGRRGSGKRFHAGFPASSPYATAVGGTDFVQKDVVGEEMAWTGSGGGFSDHFGVPAYQAAAVAAYLHGNATAGKPFPKPTAYNASGRGFPDVAALAGSKNRYCIVSKKKNSGAYGTSAATPVVATIVARLNAHRAAAGKPTLGFLNPLLYQHPEAFHDITQGCNGGQEANACKNGYGFPAVKGWDAATGLGTPNFAALLKVVDSLA